MKHGDLRIEIGFIIGVLTVIGLTHHLTGDLPVRW